MESTFEPAGNAALPRVQEVQAVASRSCNLCRQRKVRCDRVEPRCSACSRLDLNCSFSDLQDPVSTTRQDAVDQLTEAGIRRRRTRNACLQCRAQKARCSGSDPCERCRSRGVRCESKFTPKYTGIPGRRDYTLRHELTPDLDLMDCNIVLADKSKIRQCIEAYFDHVNPMTCIFLHKPTVLASLSRSRLNSDMTILLCSLGLLLGSYSQKQRDAATTWAVKTQLRVLSSAGAQTIEQLQLLVLLLHFHFLTGTTGELWNLISLAARLVFTLQLNYERRDIDPILQESQRRLVWAIYLLDRILSGGVEDLAVCPVERIHIRIPCDDHAFHRGVLSRAGYLSDKDCTDAAVTDFLAYHIKFMAIRDRVLRYTKHVRRQNVSPVVTKDELQGLELELQGFKDSLPQAFQLTPDKLLLMIHSVDAHAYIMLHTHWFQSHCDLYRFLIPGIRESVSRQAFENTPPEYINYCQHACISNALQLCDLWSNISRLGLHEPPDDPVFLISIFQVSQILHHLHQLLPYDGPHSLSRIKPILCEACEMASLLQRKYPRIRTCLNDTQQLLRGIETNNWPKSSSLADKNRFNSHLSSLHTMIPKATEQADTVEVPAFETSLRAPVIREASLQEGMIATILPEFNSDCGNLNNTNVFDIYDMRFNSYYSLE